MQLVRRAALAAGLALGAAFVLPTAASAAPAGVVAASASSQDKAWMIAAHQSNLTEIAAGKAAQQKATTQKVRDLGAMFIRDHTAQDAQLTKAASSLGVSLPGAPNPQQRAALASVAAKSGAAFDTAWIASQTTGHAQTLAATDKEIANGSNATALKLAKASRPVIAMHYSELKAAGGTSPSAVGAGTGGQAAGSLTGEGLALTGAGLLLAAAAGATLRSRRRVEA
jgi:putative membrane protein